MTYEEALQDFRNTKQILEKAKGTAKESFFDNIDKNIAQIDLAIEALEKQIPKKPNIEGDGYSDGELVYDIWVCPNCGTCYELEYDRFKYCPECGQAIDMLG